MRCMLVMDMITTDTGCVSNSRVVVDTLEAILDDRAEVAEAVVTAETAAADVEDLRHGVPNSGWLLAVSNVKGGKSATKFDIGLMGCTCSKQE